MTYRGFLSRSDIGLRSPRSVSHNITPENGGVAGHYAGPAQNVDSHSDCLRLWRGYQAYHMDTHGWVDIAYTLGVCDHGYILAGRGAGVRTAANGTNTGNQNYYAVCWIGGQGETPTQDAVDAFWAAVSMLRSQGNAGGKVVRHSYFKSTSCPGNLGTVIDQGPQEEDMPNKEEFIDWVQEAIFDAGFGRTNPESFAMRVAMIRTHTNSMFQKQAEIEAKIDELAARQGIDPDELAAAVAERVNADDSQKTADAVADEIVKRLSNG